MFHNGLRVQGIGFYIKKRFASINLQKGVGRYLEILSSILFEKSETLGSISLQKIEHSSVNLICNCEKHLQATIFIV